jgi:hypothetical protein
MPHLLHTIIQTATKPKYRAVRSKEIEQLSFRQKFNIVKKYLHRIFELYRLKQNRKLVDRCNSHKVLFIYAGVNNIGDALMDLSGRVLLKDSSIHMDCLIDPSLAFLFSPDDVFKQVFTDPNEVPYHEYGFVVLNNLNLRTIRLKAKHAPDLPFSSMLGHFFDVDYNHIELSYAAFRDIFNLKIDDQELKTSAKLTLTPRSPVSKQVQEKMVGAQRTIALGIGGRESYRVYEHWLEVLLELDGLEDIQPITFLLLGSANAQGMAKKITEFSFQNIRVIDLTNALSLTECASVIEQTDLFVSADGGLLHVAHCTDTPTVGLFSADVPANMRTVASIRCLPLMSSYEVSSIPADEVASKVVQFFAGTES